MEESERAKIRNIKSQVMAMLEERQALESRDTSLASPSAYWSDFCSYFDYMLGLPEEYFVKLRLRTYHLTGDNYQTYYFREPGDALEGWQWNMLTDGIPSQYILNEPEGGIGFHLADGRFVSRDITVYQRMISSLYSRGVLAELLRRRKNYVLEIGGGYGASAHHFSNICPSVTYIIVDLPETLLFSASYLSLLNPQKKIYVYDRVSFPDLVQSGALDSYDFVLIPNYKFRLLSHLHFDLAINVRSLQEMTTAQAEAYLDFIKETCRGIFYSYNQDHQLRNGELANLSELLRQRFDLVEALDCESHHQKEKMTARRRLKAKLRVTLKTIGVLVGLLDRPDKAGGYIPDDLPYREYICKAIGPTLAK